MMNFITKQYIDAASKSGTKLNFDVLKKNIKISFIVFGLSDAEKYF
jgi:hypothetical protein